MDTSTVTSDAGLEIVRVLTVSTGHVTRFEADTIGDCPAPGTYPNGYGAFVVVPDFDGDGDEGWGLYPNVRAVLVFAAARGCGIVRFDADGPRVDGLTFFDW